ncbi:MAG: fructose-bisphosphate aldolase / 2-amino-3,7-dideoxy-D-threo-hept-6-ulosonate synthase [Thermoplasmata archaeon]|nr:fructose-bisphosphate aldolase / 2-amino-3,7-dideoxy-D-threo-hept-6-ulosonate synthase [Thermoplasmata archaeon]
MTSVGKRLRLRRLLGAEGKGVIVPMDHGVSDGPLPGLERPAETAAAVARGGADSIVVHKGVVRSLAGSVGGMGVWLHVSASTGLNPDPNDKRVVASVEEALRLGADGLSVHVNVGSPEESRMIEDVGRLSDDCDRYGLPLLAMMYPRGHEITNPHDLKLVKKVARLGYELGADIIKVPYTGSPDTFREVVRSVDVPVVISGGPKADTDRAFLEMVAGSLAAGGAGVSVGRNLWQHKDVAGITRAVGRLVHGKATLDEVVRDL